MESVQRGQIVFTESTNKKRPQQAIKTRVWSHTGTRGDLALKVLLNNPKEKLGRQVQEAMCRKYRCFLAILLRAHLLLNVYNALEGVLHVATHWYDGVKT